MLVVRWGRGLGPWETLTDFVHRRSCITRLPSAFLRSNRNCIIVFFYICLVRGFHRLLVDYFKAQWRGMDSFHTTMASNTYVRISFQFKLSILLILEAEVDRFKSVRGQGPSDGWMGRPPLAQFLHFLPCRTRSPCKSYFILSGTRALR